MISALAQLASDNASALLNYGPLGLVCAWLMWKIDRLENKLGETLGTKLGDLAHRIDGLTRAMLVDMTERESAGPRTRAYAQETIQKIDARLARDAEPPKRP